MQETQLTEKKRRETHKNKSRERAQTHNAQMTSRNINKEKKHTYKNIT